MIVECPGCQSRYDVTGRPPGTRARCRCGTIFELPSSAAQAEMLACPQCGGNVSATNHRCEFCRAELLVKACPRCFAKIFHGAKHCTQCGASAVAPASANPDGTAATLLCPRCVTKVMDARLVGDVLLDECPTCHGVWLDTPALERIVDERRQTRAQALMGGLRAVEISSNEVALTQPDGPMYVKCPECQNVMNRCNFASGSGVIIDVCKNHGTWFDTHELPLIIDFVMKGGLGVAERRDLERERERLRNERSRTTSSPGLSMMSAPPPQTELLLFGPVLRAVARMLKR